MERTQVQVDEVMVKYPQHCHAVLQLTLDFLALGTSAPVSAFYVGLAFALHAPEYATLLFDFLSLTSDDEQDITNKVKKFMEAFPLSKLEKGDN